MAASCAEEVALQYAISAAIPSPSRRAFPAARAAGPNAANTPAPIIDPSPMTTASPIPSRRARRLGASAPATMGHLYLYFARFSLPDRSLASFSNDRRLEGQEVTMSERVLEETRDMVRDHYSKVARTDGACGCAPGCCAPG